MFRGSQYSDLMIGDPEFAKVAIVGGTAPIDASGDANGRSLFFEVLELQDPKVTTRFLARAQNLDVNQKDMMGRTALLLLAETGTPENLGVLINNTKGLDITAQNMMERDWALRNRDHLRLLDPQRTDQLAERRARALRVTKLLHSLRNRGTRRAAGLTTPLGAQSPGAPRVADAT